MNGKATSELCQLFENWRAEARSLSSAVDEIRDWMSQVNQMGIPHFGETASRLQPFREVLRGHFEREDEMLGKLTEMYSPASPEVEAFARQTRLDHSELISRLDDLHHRLQEIDPQFVSWTEAMDEVDVFFAALEQHELLESDRMMMLVPEIDGARDCFD